MPIWEIVVGYFVVNLVTLFIWQRVSVRGVVGRPWEEYSPFWEKIVRILLGSVAAPFLLGVAMVQRRALLERMQGRLDRHVIGGKRS